VDRVLIVDTWHHIPERVSYAQKLRAALRSGGQIYIVDFKRDAQHGPPVEHRIPPEVTIAELQAAGLTATLAPLQLPEQYVVVGTL
jgi:SAM-dependent methyltransferase